MKLRTLAVLIVVLVIAALCCAGCLQELPLGDKYINEAVGHLRVRNTSTEKSPYVITAVELRNSAGEVIKTWEGLELLPGAIWTGDLDLEGSFILYCTVRNTEEGTTGTFYHDKVEIKLHAVADSGITGEVYLSTADTDNDGFSDFWENAHKDEGFNPEDPSDGGTVYVSSAGSDESNGTAEKPYFTLAKGVWKAKSGLTGDARTVVVTGELNRNNGNPGSDRAVMYIDDTGPHGVTVTGEKDKPAIINAGSTSGSQKSALYLGPGTRLTLKNITIINGFAYRGGGIHAKGAELTLGEGAVIRNCTASAAGAVYGYKGAVIIMEKGSLIGVNEITDTEKPNKSINGEGGAVGLYNGSSLTMKGGSRITNNLSGRGGAAVDAGMGSLVILEDGAEISANSDEDPSNRKVSNGGGASALPGKANCLWRGASSPATALPRAAAGCI
jgi:hypothetical protein